MNELRPFEETEAGEFLISQFPENLVIVLERKRDKVGNYTLLVESVILEQQTIDIDYKEESPKLIE